MYYISVVQWNPLTKDTPEMRAPYYTGKKVSGALFIVH